MKNFSTPRHYILIAMLVFSCALPQVSAAAGFSSSVFSLYDKFYRTFASAVDSVLSYVVPQPATISSNDGSVVPTVFTYAPEEIKEAKATLNQSLGATLYPVIVTTNNTTINYYESYVPATTTIITQVRTTGGGGNTSGLARRVRSLEERIDGVQTDVDTLTDQIADILDNGLVSPWAATGTTAYYLNGNVGIGTSNVSRGRLEIFQGIDSSAGGIALVNSGVNGSLRLWVNASSSAVIDSGANGTNPLILNRGGGQVEVGGSLKASIFDKNGQVANVKAYGAVGDGSADDTTAVLAAISAAASDSAGVVYFPCGVYHITSILINKRVVLQGAGECTRLLYTPSTGTAFTFNFPGTLTFGSGLRDLVLSGTNRSNPTIGIMLGGNNGATGFLGDSIKIQGFGIGIQYGDQTWLTKFDHSIIVNNGKNLFYPNGLFNSGENLMFRDTTFANTNGTSSATCVDLQGGLASGIFDGGSFDSCRVNIGASAFSIVLSNNHFENPGGSLSGPYIVSTGANVSLVNPNFYLETYDVGVDSMVSASSGKIKMSGATIIVNNVTPLPYLVSLSGTAELFESGTMQRTGITNLVNNTGTGRVTSQGATFASFGGSVGIGTSTPNRALHIVGTGLTTSTGVQLQDPATGGRSYSFVSTNNTSGLGGGKFAIFDDMANASRLVVDSSGNVGIGTTTPSQRLDVWGSLRVGTSSNPSLFVNAGSGNVGIGTANPAFMLQIEGASALASLKRYAANGVSSNAASSGGFLLTRAQGSQASPLPVNAGDWLGKVQFRGFDGSADIDYGAFAFIASDTVGNGRFAFMAPGIAEDQEKFTILSNGNVGIGTTTPGVKLAVNGTTTVESLYASNIVKAPIIHTYSSYTAFGDSITEGCCTSISAANQYFNAIANTLGIPITKRARSGDAAADSQEFVYQKIVSGTSSELFTYMIGTNDLSAYFSTGQLTNSQLFQRAANAWLAIPHENKVIGQSTGSSSPVYAGTWLDSSYYGGNIGRYSTTNGATATFTIKGTTAYIAYTMEDGNGGQFSVTIDGVNYGTYSNTGTSGGQILTPQRNRNFGSALLRIPNLSEGTHTVVLTVTSPTSASNKVYFDWAAGNKGFSLNKGPAVFVGGTILASSGSPSAATIYAYNERTKENVRLLAADGLNIAYVDTASYMVLTQDYINDGIHPNDSGMLHIADAFLNEINATLRPSTKQNALGGYGIVNRLVTWGSDNTLTSGSLFDTGLLAGVNGTSTLTSFFVRGNAGYNPFTVASSSGSTFFTVLQSGNVGIGTSTPSARLDVNGNIALTGASSRVFKDDATDLLNMGILDGSGTPKGGYIQMFGNNYTNSAQRGGAEIVFDTRNSGTGGFSVMGHNGTTWTPHLKVDVFGNVGIGTSSPSTRLSVAGNILGTGTLSVASSTFTNFTAGSIPFFATGGSLNQSNANLFWDNTNSRLGIGIATPGFPLAVEGTVGLGQFKRYSTNDAAAGAGGILITRSRGTAALPVVISPGDWLGKIQFRGFDSSGDRDFGVFTFIAADSLGNGRFAFVTPGIASDQEKLSILSSGNVGIGTTTPLQRLVVTGNAQFTAVGSAAAANDIRITADGVLTTNTSDERLKDNVVSLASTTEQASTTLQKLLVLNPVSYTWKGDTEGKMDFGFIAQDMEKIFPEITFVNKTDGFMGINYSRLPALIIAGMQEMWKKIESMATFFETKEVKTDKLCISDASGETCLSRDQVDQLLENSSRPVSVSYTDSTHTDPTTEESTTTSTTTETTVDTHVTEEETVTPPVEESAPVEAPAL